MLSCATSSSPCLFWVLYEVHRANTMYCSFTNQMLQVPFLLLQHREPSLHLFIILLIKLAATSTFFWLSLILLLPSIILLFSLSSLTAFIYYKCCYNHRLSEKASMTDF